MKYYTPPLGFKMPNTSSKPAAQSKAAEAAAHKAKAARHMATINREAAGRRSGR